MATGPLAVELETKGAKSASDLTIRESCQASHLGHGDRHAEFLVGFLLVAEYAWKRIAMCYARLHNLAGKSLGDFDSLGDTAPFSDQPGNVRACSQIAPAAETFHANPDCDLLDFRELLVCFHVIPFRGHYTKAW